MIPGECKGLEGHTCECGFKMELEVLSTPAGYYLGYMCDECGPYSRETGYYKTKEEAEEELVSYMVLNERT